MISLEGLTLDTGRAAEGAAILLAFARHVRDGLIPNLFPEGTPRACTTPPTRRSGCSTRSIGTWRRRETGARCGGSSTMEDVVRHHVRGTRYGIGVDPSDGLLRQGAEGYALTWMDAKFEGWVITPRRGKAVEINALWYHALRAMERWLASEGRDADAVREMAERARASFNQRFWYAEGGHLYDIVDCDGGEDDPACRPNQILAVSLPDPVLDRALGAGGRRCASSCSRPWGAIALARAPRPGRATTGISARATRPTIRARSGAGSSDRSSTRG